MKISPDDLPDIATILELWQQAYEKAPMLDVDPKILKQIKTVKAYSDINTTFKKLLADHISQ